jgi:hypothetical protein
MTDIAVKTPATVIAGDTWQWLRTFDNYPSTLYALTYYFQNGSNRFEIAASASGSDFLVTFSSESTKEIAAGEYNYFARLSSLALTKTIEQGTITVLPDPASANAQDYRTENRKILDAITAALKQKATRDQLATSVAGRTISRYSITELIELQKRYEAKCELEETPGKRSGRRDIKLRFTSP